MEGEAKKEINLIGVGLVISQFFFMIIMIVAFSGLFNEEPIRLEDTIGDSAQGLGLEEAETDGIDFYLYNAIVASSNVDNLGKIETVVRDGSMINFYDQENKIHYVNYIIDIPSLEQSYQAYHVWSDDTQNVVTGTDGLTGVMCLEPDQLIYGEFNCVSTNLDARNLIIKGMLQITKFDGFSVIAKESSGTADVKFMIQYADCDSQCVCRAASESEKQIATNKFGEFVEGLGFRLKDIDYYFDNC